MSTFSINHSVKPMRICVVGLWHLGCVTAACLSKAGHQVIALDENADTVANLRRGKAPLFEPGLESCIAEGCASGLLRFETDRRAAAEADVVWITYDTPVDDNDRPQTTVVID